MQTTSCNLLLVLSGIAAGACLSLVPSHGSAQNNRNVTIVVPDEPESLDACEINISINSRILKQNITESLTEIDPNNGDLKPRLATSWEKVNDRTWRLMLREGVAFSDGAPFNADAAASAIARTMDRTLGCNIGIRYFETTPLTTKVIDAHTLELSADTPLPILPTRLSVLPIVSPNQPRDKMTNSPVGTGPYVLEAWRPGVEVVLARNPNYWGGRPEVDKATFVWRGESSVRASMVKIGEADFAPTIAAQDATDPAMDVSFLNAETTWLKIDVEVPPLDDIRLRKAMNYAIDREALRGTIFPKNAIPATQLVIPAVAGHNPNLKVWPYDPEQAKQLIAEAKKDGADVDAEIIVHGRVNYYPNGHEAMEAVIAMLNAVGFNLKLEMLDRAVWNEINRRPHPADRQSNVVQSQHDNDKGDAIFTFDPRYGCNGVSSVTCWSDIDAMSLKASTLSGRERVNAWQELFRIIHEDKVPDVQLFHMVGFARVGPRINFTPTVATNTEIQIAQMTFK